ncbi:MAG: hypothetical protein IJK89_02730 [Clostridia bacterium]|nr:hypothetical protein [Clostridia bacterium]
MPIKVEAAVVTQKKSNTPFNTDSVNINGKLLPHEVVQNGYKGTGVMEGTVFFSLSSSEIEGFADASVAAFNERADNFHTDEANPSEIITGYFKDSVYALGEMGHRSSELASSVMYAAGNTVILAKTGSTQLYAYSKNGIAKVAPALFSNEDGYSQYGICTFPAVFPDDIFLLVSPGVSQVLTDKDLDDICKVADGSVKKIVSLIAKVTAAKEGSGGISAIAVKVVEAEEEKGKLDFGFAGAGDKIDSEIERIDEPVPAASLYEPLTETSSSGDGSQTKKTKKLTVAVLVALVIIVLLAIAALGLKMFGGNIGQLFSWQKEPSTVVVTTTEKAAETTTKQAVTTTSPVTTTMPVTTTVPVTTTAKDTSSASATSRTTTAR